MAYRSRLRIMRLITCLGSVPQMMKVARMSMAKKSQLNTTSKSDVSSLS